MVEIKKEIARDFLALGSWVFYLLVIGRVLVLPYRWPYLNHLLIIGFVILILDIMIRDKVELYVTRALVLIYFTSIFYDNSIYNSFLVFVLIGFVLSLIYLKKDIKKIGIGVVIGLITIGISILLG